MSHCFTPEHDPGGARTTGLRFRPALRFVSDEHRDQRVGDRENVDQHNPEHGLHDAAHLTAIGLTVHHRTPTQKREEHDHRAKTLEERLKQRHDIDERRARARAHERRAIRYGRRRIARERRDRRRDARSGRRKRHVENLVETRKGARKHERKKWDPRAAEKDPMRVDGGPTW